MIRGEGILAANGAKGCLDRIDKIYRIMENPVNLVNPV